MKDEKKQPMVFAYLTDEEKKAFDILAKLENRSGSNLIKVEMVKLLKERGLLKEELNESGEIVQTVLVGSEQAKGGDLD